jgi:hypothetical protein
MGDNAFAPYSSPNTFFVVMNVSPQIKTIKIFNYPILMNTTRDLMQIPGVSEADIRASLLKGELQHKLLSQDIVIMASDIDLTQYNTSQLNFLIAGGVNYGTSPTPYNQQYIKMEDITLQGIINGVNVIFTTPGDDFFVQDTLLKIIVYWNGVKQAFNDDYILGPYSDGYISIILTVSPQIGDIITADYYIQKY